MNWAVEECSRQCLENNGDNKRKVLGDALFLIRFPTMPLREFANSASRARVLTAEEKCSVFEYLTCERTEVSITDLPGNITQKVVIILKFCVRIIKVVTDVSKSIGTRLGTKCHPVFVSTNPVRQ